jgi:hypothetical protein
VKLNENEGYYNFSIFETQKIEFDEKNSFYCFLYIYSNIFNNFGAIFVSEKTKCGKFENFKFLEKIKIFS